MAEARQELWRVRGEVNEDEEEDEEWSCCVEDLDSGSTSIVRRCGLVATTAVNVAEIINGESLILFECDVVLS